MLSILDGSYARKTDMFWHAMQLKEKKAQAGSFILTLEGQRPFQGSLYIPILEGKI